MKLIRSFLLCLSVLAMTATPVRAQYYGVGQEFGLVVDKKVAFLNDKDFVDNLDKSRPAYENDVLEFKIWIKNSGNETLENIQVEDRLPTNLTVFFNPGSFDEGNRKINWQIDKLEPGETKEFLIRIKIAGTGKGGLIEFSQMTNVVEAKNDKASDSDNASYFIGAKEIPETGDMTLVTKSLMLAVTVGVGFGMRKVARGW